MKLTILEENGFKKQFEIEKAVTRIGSASANDVQLRSDLVSPFHLQILHTREAPDRCKVVNLATEAATVIRNGQEHSLSPYAADEISAGDELRLKGFRIQFELPMTSGVISTSSQISAALILPEPVMRPNTTLVGRITLKNQGDQHSCQFQIEISGLPEDCYQIDPIPLMYPGAHEEVNIRFFHRKTYPHAGSQSVTLSVTAPDDYPGEQVSIQQGIYVMPVLEQSLLILDDMPTPQAIVHAPAPEPILVVPESASLPLEAPARVEVLSEPVAAPVAELAEPVLAGEAPQPARSIPVKPKVVRTPAESFWDE
jgi:hypothetical protein